MLALFKIISNQHAFLTFFFLLNQFLAEIFSMSECSCNGPLPLLANVTISPCDFGNSSRCSLVYSQANYDRLLQILQRTRADGMSMRRSTLIHRYKPACVVMDAESLSESEIALTAFDPLKILVSDVAMAARFWDGGRQFFGRRIHLQFCGLRKLSDRYKFGDASPCQEEFQYQFKYQTCWYDVTNSHPPAIRTNFVTFLFFHFGCVILLIKILLCHS